MRIHAGLSGGWIKPACWSWAARTRRSCCASADLDAAAEGVMRSAFSLQNQKCSATSRVYVHREVAAPVRRAAAREDPRHADGRPDPSATSSSARSSTSARWRASSGPWRRRGREGRSLLGGARLRGGVFDRGHFVAPTVARLPLESSLYREELFVPFLAVGEVAGLDQALAEDQPGRVRAHRRHLLRRSRGGRAVLRRDRGRRLLRQQAHRRHHGRLAGRAAVLRLEGLGLHRQGRLRALLRRAVHAGAEPDGHRRDEEAHDSMSRSATIPDRRPPPGPQGPARRRARRGVDLHLLHQGVSARRRARAGRHGRGRRRQPLPRLHGRHRGLLHRLRPPQGGRGGPGRGRPVPAHLRHRLLLRGDGRAVRAAGPARARAAKKRVFLTNSGTEAVEGAIKLARYATRRTAIIAFQGAFHGRTTGAVSLTSSKARQHAGLRPAAARRAPRPVRLPLPLPVLRRRAGLQPRLHRRASSRTSSPATSTPTTWRPSSSSRSRAKAATSCRRRASSATCARSATGTASCSWPTKSSRASAAPGRCGPASTRASSPTSCSPPRGSAPGMPIGAIIAKESITTWESGVARLHLRRQPGLLRRGAGHARPGRGRPDGQRRASWASG